MGQQDDESFRLQPLKGSPQGQPAQLELLCQLILVDPLIGDQLTLDDHPFNALIGVFRRGL